MKSFKNYLTEDMGGDPVPFTKRAITVEQVFDEPIEEIFDKLLPLRDSKKYDDSRDAASR